MDFRVRGEGVVTAELRNVVLEKTEVRGDSRCEFRRRFGKKIKKECGQCNTGGLPTVASQYTEGARSQDSEARFLMMNKGFDLLYTRVVPNERKKNHDSWHLSMTRYHDS